MMNDNRTIAEIHGEAIVGRHKIALTAHVNYGQSIYTTTVADMMDGLRTANEIPGNVAINIFGVQLRANNKNNKCDARSKSHDYDCTKIVGHEDHHRDRNGIKWV